MSELPTCCPEKVFFAWRDAARQTGNVKSFCVDCTPSHKAQMTVAGKCNATDVRFREDSDGFVEGFHPKATTVKSPDAAKKELSAAKAAHMADLRKMRDEAARMKLQINEQKIILSLHTGPCPVSAIVRKTGIGESTVYKHLNRLIEERKVFYDKQAGKATVYRMGML